MAKAMTIYGDRVSGNCLKVKWLADLTGVSYDWVDVNVVKRETRTSEFLKLNPAGQVPFVKWPDGRGMAQSNALIFYLAESAGSALIPSDPWLKAEMLQWMFWEQYSHETAIAVRRFHKTFLKKPDNEIDPALMQKGQAVLAVMENHLLQRDWFVGEEISLADIALVAYTRVAHEGGFELSDFPKVDAWVSRVEKALGLASAR